MLETSVQPAGAQQKDNLCGPFWAARILVEAGFREWDGQPVDEDLVALRAGTMLPPVTQGVSVPPGATSRTNYRFELGITSMDESGTSPDGLMGVIESASGGALRCVPVRGKWTAGRVEALVAEARALDAQLIANLRTGRLWGTRPKAEALLAELAGRQVDGPPAEWDVGHFVELAMVVSGPGGSLVVVNDSYPTLGWEGRHLQPPRVLAEALVRGDGREGGVLAVVAKRNTKAMTALVNRLGLDVGTWNNGSRSDGNGDR